MRFQTRRDMKFQGDLLRSREEFQNPREAFEFSEEHFDISRTVLRYYGCLSYLKRSSEISGRVLRSQGGF